jgi:hypothetical protein
MLIKFASGFVPHCGVHFAWLIMFFGTQLRTPMDGPFDTRDEPLIHFFKNIFLQKYLLLQEARDGTFQPPNN